MQNKNERKQTNRDVEQDRNTGSKYADNNTRDGEFKRPLSWDARNIKTNPGLRGGTGEYENRFFE